MKSHTRPASHADSWYDGSPKVLAEELSKYLSNSPLLYPNPNKKALKALIIPHAGYSYCGAAAGSAFQHVNPEDYTRIVTLGPSHFAYIQGCGWTTFTDFETPFGNIKIDTASISTLLSTNPKLFTKLQQKYDIQEHSIEMMLPFLKYLYAQKNREFTLIPIVVGETTWNQGYEIAKSLIEFYRDSKTWFVISSDFCHWGSNFDFMFYDKTKGEIWQSIQYLDELGLDLISKGDPSALGDYFEKYQNTICGRHPITVLLCVMETVYGKCGASEFKCVKYAQSEKVKNNKGNSVSYAGCVFYV